MTTLILFTDWVEKLIMAGLIGLSILSISLIIERRRVLKQEIDLGFFAELREYLEKNQFAEFNARLVQKKGLLAGALARACENSQSVQSIDRVVASIVATEKVRLEKGLGILATLGANAPFLGLFGTVLGIIRSFAYLGSQGGSAAVMTGVSQALYATALGLLVAIPAVVAFNIFSRQIRDLISWTESLRDLFISKKKW